MTWGQRRAIIIIVLAVFLVILCIVAMKPSRSLRLTFERRPGDRRSRPD